MSCADSSSAPMQGTGFPTWLLLASLPPQPHARIKAGLGIEAATVSASSGHLGLLSLSLSLCWGYSSALGISLYRST